MILGLLILVVSLLILAWSLWPLGYASRSVPIPPAEMQLPTPGSFLPLFRIFIA